MKIYHEVCGQQTETVVPIIPQTPGVSLFDKKIRSFLDAVKNGTPAPVPTSQILYNQAILSGIAQSANEGKEIKLDIPDLLF